jgi:crotonobetainyl-CoA:carnitine CoA-transferase CaiB-like acyl-CoA transferase
MIGQAFGGTMYQTGFPENPPTRAAPWMADYITALFCLSSSLAALHHARETGRGQTIDIAQFEAIHAILGGTMIEYFQLGTVRERSGNKSPAFQPYDVYQCSDGSVVIAAPAPTIHEKVCRLLGLDHSDPYWAGARTEINDVNGLEFDALLRGWCEERTMADVIDTLNEQGIPCAPIMNAQHSAEDPHYQARGVHTEWDDDQVGHLKGTGVAPRFSATPARVWRGTGAPGADNVAVLGGLLGYSESELAILGERGVIEPRKVALA